MPSENRPGRAITRAAIKQGVAARFPGLAGRRYRRHASPIDLHAIVLGRNSAGELVLLPERPRLEHAHVIGTTGGGKSTFLLHCIQQDILNGRGVLIVDPHGNHPDSLYRSLLSWLVATGLTGKRVLHLVDPNVPAYTVGFNPLGCPEGVDLSVIAGTTLEAFEQAWGEDSQNKPTIRRVLLATFTALAELRLTLAEADLLFDPHDELFIRKLVCDRVGDRFARRVFRRLHQLAIDDRSKREFNAEVVGPENRIAEFIRSEGVRHILGQRRNTLDLQSAMDEGHIILVNLAGGSRVYEGDAELLGRLLTRFLFFHALRRKHPERPFFFYLDEAQRYLSGDVERLLAEARKFGVGCVLSHQWQRQLVRDGDETILEAVQNATNLKAVFRVKSVKEASELAEAVVPLNLETPVKALVKPTVVGHQRTLFRSSATAEHRARSAAVARGVGYSDSEGWGDTDMEGRGTALATGSSGAQSSGNAMTVPWMGWNMGFPAFPDTVTLTAGQSSGSNNAEASSKNSGSARSRTGARSTTHSEALIEAHTSGSSQVEGTTEGLEPIYEDLPSAIHSKENVLYYAALMLRSLKTGQAFVNYVGRNGMISTLLTVPKPVTFDLSAVDFAALQDRVLAVSPSALPSSDAAREIADRERELIAAAAAYSATPPLPEPETFRVLAPKAADPGELTSYRVSSPKPRKHKK